jgi:hypothetical protein
MNTITQSTKKWTKGSDPFDNTPRYTFEGRDPSNTVSDIAVVIYSNYERKYSHDPSSRKLYYYGEVRHNPSETADRLGRFETLKEAKQETEKLFNEYCELFPNDIEAW